MTPSPNVVAFVLPFCVKFRHRCMWNVDEWWSMSTLERWLPIVPETLEKDGVCYFSERLRGGALCTRRAFLHPRASKPLQVLNISLPRGNQPYIRRPRTLTCTLVPLASVGRNDHVPRLFFFCGPFSRRSFAAAQRTNQDRSDGVADRALRRVPGERPEEGLQRQGLWRHVRKTPFFFFFRRK